jgi:hypothetical protein
MKRQQTSDDRLQSECKLLITSLVLAATGLCQIQQVGGVLAAPRGQQKPAYHPFLRPNLSLSRANANTNHHFDACKAWKKLPSGCLTGRPLGALSECLGTGALRTVIDSYTWAPFGPQAHLRFCTFRVAGHIR